MMLVVQVMTCDNCKATEAFSHRLPWMSTVADWMFGDWWVEVDTGRDLCSKCKKTVSKAKRTKR